MLREQLLVATLTATSSLVLYNKVVTPWLRERAWAMSDRARARAMSGLWRVQPQTPAHLTALHFLSFIISCALGGVAICSGAGWVLLTAVPSRTVLVLRTISFLGQVFAAGSVGAILWVPARDLWCRHRGSVEGRSTADGPGAGQRKLPVTLVTGYLGAGKSTLVQRLLREQHGLRILVIENELGEVGIDNELLLQHTEKEDVILLNNGCLCCRVRRDLVTALRALVDKMPLLDGCVIETTGVADPSPVAQTFFADEVLKEHCYLDAILTVVDCKHVLTQLTEGRKAQTGASGRRAHLGINEVAQQICFADRVLLNKSDLVSPSELARTRARVEGLNAAAMLFETTRGKGVELRELIGIHAFDPSRHQERHRGFDPPP